MLFWPGVRGGLLGTWPNWMALEGETLMAAKKRACFFRVMSDASI